MAVQAPEAYVNLSAVGDELATVSSFCHG